jgi:hypothetical protein
MKGFSRFGLKTGGDGFSRFDFKTGGDGFPILPQNRWRRFSGLALVI